MFFRYTVKYNDEDSNDEVKVEKGLVAQKNYGKACNYVVEYYGIDNVIEVTLEAWVEIMTDEELIEGLKS